MKGTAVFHNIGPNRFGYIGIRILLAVLLLAVAGLKGHQLATSPVLGSGLLDSRWLLIATVEFELFFGLWLLSGLLPRLTWAVAVSCFGLFATVSLYKAASGEASCGCFGRVEVNPWYTFTLDVVAVFALLRWRPSGWASSTRFPTRTFVLRSMAVTSAWVAVGVPAAVDMGTYQPSMLSEDGAILGDDNLVILEPEKWIGKRFPLLPFIKDAPGQRKPGERPLRELLAVGNWITVLYHHDCPECQKAIMKYRKLARSSALDSRVPHVAFLEVPPYGEVNSLQPSPEVPYALGRLSNKKEWFVQTPAIVESVKGLVEGVPELN